MKTRLTLAPGANGTKKLVERYGSRPVCVRYRYDEERRRRVKTVDFLGFTHYWAGSLSGRWVIKRKTMAKRLARKAHEIWQWCRQNRHEPVE